MIVAEKLLEKSGKAVMSGDLAAFASCFFMPQEIQTFEGSRWVLNINDLEQILTDLRQNFSERGITDMVRRVITARFTGPDTIESAHETRLLAGNQIVNGPYPTFSILQKTDDNWQVSFSQYAVQRGDEHHDALIGRRSRPTKPSARKDGDPSP